MYLAFILLFSATCVADRLSYTYIPGHYLVKLELKENFLQTFAFNGTVKTKFRIRDDQRKPTILYRHLKLTFCSIIRVHTSERVVPVKSMTTARLRIVSELKKNQQPCRYYELNMRYRGKINNESYGLHAISFPQQQPSDWIFATRMSPMYVQTVLPILDEPNFRAAFKLVVIHPKGYTVISNTPFQQTIEHPEKHNLQITTFKETPRMAPHLLGFVISKHFSAEPVSYTLNGVLHRFHGMKRGSFAAGLAVELFDSLSEITGVSLNQSGLAKIDHVAIPGFSLEAQANWGLIIYRESAIQLLDSEAIPANKQKVASVMAYAAAYTFFGNLRICNWWNMAWLIEGISKFFQYYAISRLDIAADWEMMNQFVTEELQPMLDADDLYSAAPLYLPETDVATDAAVCDAFNFRTYRKGASIMWMLRHILGDGIFIEGIRRYMSNDYLRHFRNVSEHALWNAWTPDMVNHSLPRGKTVADVMTNWTTEPGYPIVEVKALFLNTTRYLPNLTNCSFISCRSSWYVPTTYTTSTYPIFESKPTKDRWISGNATLQVQSTAQQDWLVANLQSMGYLRVHYDENTTISLLKTLTSHPQLIHVLNRAQMINDAISLALSDHIPAGQLMKILSYLKKEVDYYPWYSALRGFDYFKRRLDTDKKNVLLLYEYIKTLIEKVYRNVQENLQSTDHIDVLKRNMIMKWACQINYGDCVMKTKQLFYEYMNAEALINANVRSYTYCTGVRHWGKRGWDFLYSKLKCMKCPTHFRAIIDALGCVNNKTLLKKFFNKEIDLRRGIDSYYNEKIFMSVISHNPDGIQIALDFIIKHFNISYTDFQVSNPLENVIVELGNRIRTEKQAKQYVKFLSDRNLTNIWQSVREATERCERNIQWDKTKRAEFLGSLSGPIKRRSRASVSKANNLIVFALLVYFNRSVFVLMRNIGFD